MRKRLSCKTTPQKPGCDDVCTVAESPEASLAQTTPSAMEEVEDLEIFANSAPAPCTQASSSSAPKVSNLLTAFAKGSANGRGPGAVLPPVELETTSRKSTPKLQVQVKEGKDVKQKRLQSSGPVPAWTDVKIKRGDLRPPQVWKKFADWLKEWQPNSFGKKKRGQKLKPAALVTGPTGCGKSAGVRLLAGKMNGPTNIVEYDITEADGKSFIENIAKKQKNGNQIDGMTVAIFNVSEPISQNLKETLFAALQISPSPAVVVAGDGIFNSKDDEKLNESCTRCHVELTPPQVVRILRDIVQREGRKNF